ncbi:MAG: transglutaminase domain-containing protein [Bacteroidales bacterium]|nr:transglutaminase domain-containing protein [Bacteroidales bacterium]
MRAKIILFLLLVSLSLSAHTVAERDGYFEVEHSWKFKGKECSITLNISKKLYDYYRNDREHLAYTYKFNEDELPPNYFGFVLSEHDRPVMRAIAEEFSKTAATELERIQLALTFVQSLPYAFDANSKDVDEYVRYPIETLVDGCGDCEDKVALLAAILYEMGADYILLVLPEHMALGVHCEGVESRRYLMFQDKRYYYLETTTAGWQVGDIPEKYYAAEMEAVPVDDTPRLLIRGVRFESQSAAVFQKANCELQLDLHNLGPKKVTDLFVQVRLIENRGTMGRLLMEEQFSLNDMQEGEQRTETLRMRSLIKEHGLLQVVVSGAEIEPLSYEVELSYHRSWGR